LASFVFDPKGVADAGDATIKEAQGVLNSLEEQQAGYQLSVLDSQKAAGEKATAERDKQAKAEEAALAVLQEARNKMLDKQAQEELAINEAYKAKQKVLDEASMMDDGSLEDARQKEIQAVKDKYIKEEAERAQSAQMQLNEIITQTRLAGIQDENVRAREQILLDFQAQKDEVANNEKLKSEERTAQLLALQIQEDQALKANQKVIDEANAIKELEKLDEQMLKDEADFNNQKILLDQKLALIEQFHKDGKISDEQYTAAMFENSEARKEIDKLENQAKVQNAEVASQLLSTISDLVGKNTAAGKATAIAATTIDTYLGAQKAYASQLIPGDPSSPIRAAIAAAIAVAGGIKNVRAIMSTKVPGGGGGVSAPGISASAPAVTSAVPTLGSSPVTALGTMMQNQTPIKAYVVESEVTGSQKRVADIERRAGF
jgi:hypothetical protein